MFRIYVVLLLASLSSTILASVNHKNEGRIIAEIKVSNPTDMSCEKEIVEVNHIFGDSCFRIINSTNREIPWQITYDKKLIFPASVQANSESTYYIVEGESAPMDTIACGYFVPERLDDFAWENDRCAYRAYGPALQRKGEKAFGYDVWTKSTSKPIVMKRYKDNAKGISFHKDHGDGMDVYSVGPTLGAGTAALLDSLGSIIYPYCFTDYKILDYGPLRFTVRFDYENEQRNISLDAGSYFNKTDVIFHNSANSDSAAVGIVIHHEKPSDRFSEVYNGFSVAGYADPTDNPDADNGIIYVGTIVPDGNLPQLRSSGNCNHLLSIIPYNESTAPLTYYWGSGWSKSGISDLDTWRNIINSFVLRLDKPLKIKVVNRNNRFSRHQ